MIKCDECGVQMPVQYEGCQICMPEVVAYQDDEPYNEI